MYIYIYIHTHIYIIDKRAFHTWIMPTKSRTFFGVNIYVHAYRYVHIYLYIYLCIYTHLCKEYFPYLNHTRKISPLFWRQL